MTEQSKQQYNVPEIVKEIDAVNGHVMTHDARQALKHAKAALLHFEEEAKAKVEAAKEKIEDEVDGRDRRHSEPNKSESKDTAEPGETDSTDSE